MNFARGVAGASIVAGVAAAGYVGYSLETSEQRRLAPQWKAYDQARAQLPPESWSQLRQPHNGLGDSWAAGFGVASLGGMLTIVPAMYLWHGADGVTTGAVGSAMAAGAALVVGGAIGKAMHPVSHHS